MLEVRDLVAGYGNFRALSNVSIVVNEGETVAVVGANGAGKTTMLRAILGQVQVHGGSIWFRGEDVATVSTSRRVQQGITLVPEGRHIFPSLTVRENLLIGGHARRSGPWTVEKVVQTFPLLEPLLDRSAAKLSGGEQQALAIGRALMSNPSLLLFDEVSLGLAPVVVKQLYATLPEVTRQGTTAVVVEQDIHQAIAMSTRVYCLLEGRVSLSALSSEINKEKLTEAYFGAKV
ncbi:MAG: ABC transporter ATP-binding protein [Actinomycetota bacterium]|nr:ABC transporter ATP-binding protein [Actinomycetota bacterium]